LERVGVKPRHTLHPSGLYGYDLIDFDISFQGWNDTLHARVLFGHRVPLLFDGLIQVAQV
jgi:hypothetical protein